MNRYRQTPANRKPGIKSRVKAFVIFSMLLVLVIQVQGQTLTISEGGSQSNVSIFPGTAEVTIRAYDDNKDSSIPASDINGYLNDGKFVILVHFDIRIEGTISKTAGSAAILELRAGRDIFINADITSTSNVLHMSLRAAYSETGIGVITVSSKNITTNGGHLWMGGGFGTYTWNGLTVSTGAAVSSSSAGILLNAPSISTGAGNVYLSGRSTSSAANGHGIWLNGGSIKSTSGTIEFSGTGSSVGSINCDGLRIEGTVESETGALTFTGYSNTNEQSEGIALEPQAKFTSTGGGSISLIANIIYFNTSSRLQSSGPLTIYPTTNNASIGIGGASGTLKLPSTCFSTNIVDGFSTITVGNTTTGDITIAGITTYNDPLTFKTAGNITSGSAFILTGGANETAHINFWADADANADGYIYIWDGSAINTNGGDLVMAGGADSNSDGRPDGFATATATYSGVSIGRLGSTATAATTIQSGGGNILVKGQSTASSGNGMGINFSYGGTLDAGTGTLTMLGESSSYAGIELSAWLPGVTSYLDINAKAVDIRGVSSNTGYHGLASSQLSARYTRISAGSGGIYLYGNNTVNTAKGVEISINAATTSGGHIMVESPNYVALYAGADAHSFNASTGNTTLKTNLLSIGGNHTLTGTGTLTLEPYSAGRAINIGTTGTGTLNINPSYFSTNITDGFSGINIGNAGAGDITVNSVTFRDNTRLLNAGKVIIGAGQTLTAPNVRLQIDKNLTLGTGAKIIR